MMDFMKDLITNNFHLLTKIKDFERVVKQLNERGYFSYDVYNNVLNNSSEDIYHKKRLLLIELMKCKNEAFQGFIDILKETNQRELAKVLETKGCRPFREANETRKSVTKSTQFYDTPEHNHPICFYQTRSKVRGIALIINNYEFPGDKYRLGALEDKDNLQHVLKECAFEMTYKENRTAQEMHDDILKFEGSTKEFDICMVVIMTHGTSIGNETILYGVENRFIRASEIEDIIVKKFDKKPKIFIYQACRGENNQIQSRTETDSACNNRPIQDVLIGYSTLPKYVAHRNTVSGSWYIDAFCETIREHAHYSPIDKLLQITDRMLGNNISEENKTQTSEIVNKGFKACYLHPGIYEENGELKYYKNET